VPIKNLFDYLEAGDSIELFLEDFDGVSRAHVIILLEPELFIRKIKMNKRLRKSIL
jgi:uncharacterized protein (DUF433 family)